MAVTTPSKSTRPPRPSGTALHREVGALAHMTPSQLRAKYEQVFGETTRSGNRAWLMRRVAWRLQCLAEGDLAERADRLRQRALAMADDGDLRTTPPRMPPAQAKSVVGRIGPKTPAATPAATNGGLRPGTVLTRMYRGKRIDVLVLDPPDGFEFDGKRFRSLSAVARAVTGAAWNGRLFFGLPRTSTRSKEACA